MYNADHGDDRVVDEEDGDLLRGEVSGLTRDVPVARQISVRRVLYVRVHLNVEHFDDYMLSFLATANIDEQYFTRCSRGEKVVEFEGGGANT